MYMREREREFFRVKMESEVIIIIKQPNIHINGWITLCSGSTERTNKGGRGQHIIIARPPLPT